MLRKYGGAVSYHSGNCLTFLHVSAWLALLAALAAWTAVLPADR